MQKAGADTSLMVMSDHGFARFDRAVHLNTFLMQQGFLRSTTLPIPVIPHSARMSIGPAAWLTPWASMGSTLNLEGRENGGIVSSARKSMLLDQIAARLKAFTDPISGEHVVDRVYFPDTAFKGRNVKNSPDLFVGFPRLSRLVANGAWGRTRDRSGRQYQAWIGDHSIAAKEVPGVLLSNRKIRAAEPQLFDMTATILNEFGVAKTATMIGQSVF